MNIQQWAGCYDASWRDLIVPAAFAHPAKMARGLVARIFDELIASGALERGRIVVDPFGGIGTTAIEGASRGVHVVCCELEPKFFDLAKQNFELHAYDWAAMGRPQPRIVNGDSRKLRQHVGPALAECIVSSPPYSSDGLGHCKAHHASNDAGRAAVVGASEKFSKADLAGRDYGNTPGQLSNLAPGAVDAVIGSPPYAEIASGSGGLNTKPAKDGQQGGRSAASPSQDTDSRYGRAEGQLARMAFGAVADALVSSPPYEGSLASSTNGINWEATKRTDNQGGGHQAPGASANAAYPATDGNVGNATGETFWSAAREIVREAYAVLRPGGTAVWVVKHFVRDKQIVDFPGDWRKLCESVGFETYLEVHAMLVAEETKSHLFDGEVTSRRERKSFFRRLAEKKGSPRIDWETVYFMRKPA